MGLPDVKLRALGASYNGTEVLHGITLDISAQRVMAIIGPSGCGKSTLIRCINRMHEVIPGAGVSGEVLLGDVDVYTLDPIIVRQRIGMVFQKPNPFPTMSVLENVAAGLRLGFGRGRDPLLFDKVEQALRRAALWDEVKDILGRSGASLSGGQQQRVCIARALAIEPEVLLLDEPCSALDPSATAKIEELIQELAPTVTIVIVTHNMQQAARVSDRTAFLYLGRLVEEGETKTIFTTPRERATEDYITGRFG